MTVPQSARGWYKSSRSVNTDNCVEVNLDQPGAKVRDTKHREAATLAFSAAAWTQFLARVPQN